MTHTPREPVHEAEEDEAALSDPTELAGTADAAIAAEFAARDAIEAQERADDQQPLPPVEKGELPLDGE